VFASRAVAAGLQLARTHGVRSLRDRRSYTATTMGLTVRDPRPAFGEMEAATRAALHELRSWMPWRRADEGTSLPPNFVNTLDRTDDPGF
jgi:hypothetical protein